MKRLAILLMLVVVAACDSGDLTDPFQLTGTTFALSAVGGEPVPAHAWDFMGDPVIIDEGTLEFAATLYLAIVIRCINDCGSVPDAGTWTQTDNEVVLMSELGDTLTAAFDGATLTYADYAGRTYEWVRH